MKSASAPPRIESRSAAAAPSAPRTTQALIHALNNQLTVVVGAADWAGASSDPRLWKHALAQIARASSEMARMLREFPRDDSCSQESPTEVQR